MEEKQNLKNIQEIKNTEKENIISTIAFVNGSFVVDYHEGTEKIKVIPHPDVVLIINDKDYTSEVLIDSSDQVSYKIKENEPLTISISKDKMKVLLKLNDDFNKTKKIREFLPRSSAVIEIEQIDREDYEQTILAAVQSFFHENNIQVTLLNDVLYKEIANPTFEDIVIANGKHPINEIDEKIDLLVNYNIEEVFEEVNGVVDFKNRLRIPSVKKGQVMARILPKVPGEDGFDIFMTAIPHKLGKELKIVTMSNATHEGDTVVALSDGRPTVTIKGLKHTFNVLDSLEISDDIDPKFGNVFFNGDIVLRGNIKEDMRVEALGNIFINGNVYKATVIASQNIVINGTTFNSFILAGRNIFEGSHVFQTLSEIKTTLGQIEAAADVLITNLKKSGVEIPYGKIIAKLVEEKFGKVKFSIITFNKLIQDMKDKKIEIPPPLLQIAEVLKIFTSFHSLTNIQSKKMLQQIYSGMRVVLQETLAALDQASDITVGEVNSSILKTSGSITILKRGSVNSDLEAGNMIEVKSKNSFIKGGSIKAKKINAGIVGSHNGATIDIIVEEEIAALKIFNSNIKFPNRHFFIEEVSSPVYKMSDGQ